MEDANMKVRKTLEELLNADGEIGLQVAACLDGKLVIDTWAGLADETSGRPVDGETLFTCFSISKGILATCIHVLADRGLIDYDTPIASYWPEFAAGRKEKATIRHALTHRAGIPNDPPDFDIAMMTDWDRVCRATAAMEALWTPGARISYHPLTYGWILGELIRRVDGRSVARFLHDEICLPLKITAMHMGLPPEDEGRVANLRNAPGLTDLLSGYGIPAGHPMIDLAGVFNRHDVRRSIIPGAGLIANARSLAQHYAMLANSGELNGTRILSKERTEISSKPEPEDPESSDVRWWNGHSLGYTLGGGSGPRSFLPYSFGYEGPGIIAFADPKMNFSFAFLKNYIDLSAREMDAATAVLDSVVKTLYIG